MVTLYLLGMMDGRMFAGRWENRMLAIGFAASLGCIDYVITDD